MVPAGVLLPKEGLVGPGPFNKLRCYQNVYSCSITWKMTFSMLLTQLLHVLYVFLHEESAYTRQGVHYSATA